MGVVLLQVRMTFVTEMIEDGAGRSDLLSLCEYFLWVYLIVLCDDLVLCICGYHHRPFQAQGPAFSLRNHLTFSFLICGGRTNK
jgi:hypothetical protein